MNGNTGVINIKLKVKDDGSVIVSQFGEKIDKAGKKAKNSFSDASAALSSFKTIVAGVGFGMAAKGLWDLALEASRIEKSFGAIAGSSKGAAHELAFLRSKSDELGLEFYNVAAAYKGIYAAAQGTNLEGQKTRDVFSGVMSAASALSLSGEKVNSILTAMGQMVSNVTVQSDELKVQLAEHLPGAINLSAKAMGVSTSKLNDMMQKGELMSDVFLPRLAKLLEEKYGKAAVAASNSAEAAWNRSVTAFKDMGKELAENGFMDLAVSMIKQTTERLKDLGDWVKTNKEDIHGFFKGVETLGTSLFVVVTWLGKIPGHLEQIKAVLPGFHIPDMLIRVGQYLDEVEKWKSGEQRFKMPYSYGTIGESGGSGGTGDGSGTNFKKDIEAALKERERIQAEFESKFRAMGKSTYDVERMELDDMVKKYVAHGAKKVDVDAWVASELARISKEENADRLATVDEFNQAYKEITLSRFAMERLEVDSLGAKYIEAGADREAVERWVAARIAAIRAEEVTEASAAAEERLRASTYWADGAIRALDDYAAHASDMAASVEGLMTNAFSNMEDALVRYVTTGKLSFSDMVTSMIADIARLAIQQSITAPLASALSAGMSSFFGGWAGTGTGSYTSVDGSMTSSWATYNRHGNAFGIHGLHPFAKGGVFTNRVVSQPTVFTFGAGGAFGVMGEAGDEAVMPLTRMPSGDLGVKSSGSSPSVKINFINNVSGATGRVNSMSKGQDGTLNIDVIFERLEGQLAGGISTGRSVLADSIEATYGLNRAYGSMR